MKESIKLELKKLIAEYNSFSKTVDKKTVSEETMRTWINALLGIMGWDVRNTTYVIQEKVLNSAHKERLIEINSTHSRPDYILLNGQNIKAFIDAKDLSVDIFSDDATAFQVRSYGWSANLPCSFATNFEQFVIFDCRFKPNNMQKADMGVVKLAISDYLDNFDVLFDHLYIDNIKTNKLEELYSTTSVEGSNRLDRSFNSLLTDFRLNLAENLLTYNKTFDETILNYYVQVILDRIIFIRVCESRGIEISERLRSFKQSGFWNSFKNCCYMEFYNHYDGAMFERDKVFQEISLPDTVFNEFVDQLYYPHPYKFDVMPIKVIAQIYEDFLSKQLVISGSRVIEELKSEYVKEKGAISTPEYLVDAICKNTINLESINTINEVLNIKILDPACGSGTFMVTCFEILVQKVLELSSNEKEASTFKEWFVTSNGSTLLTVEARRELIKNCLYGIDVDEAAVEVAKMSLALKIIDNSDLLTLTEIGVFGDRILREIHQNVKLGNTLVNTDIKADASVVKKIKPIDIKNHGFKIVFLNYSGFDFIVGNPPYVETKHYKLALPEMHEYLSDKYDSFEGKADLSVLFIERCLDLLSPNGKLGFIVQKRFFKTTYGKGIRKIISSGNRLSKIIDFKSDKLFHGRMTYVAIMEFSNSNNRELEYKELPFEPLKVKTYFENNMKDPDVTTELIDSNYITEDIWAFESFRLFPIIESLKTKHGTFGQYPNLKIKDGVQVLWKRAYHFTECIEDGEYIIGKNGFDEIVKLEKDVVRPIIYNRTFYCFKKMEPHAYSLFPYRTFDNKTPITISEFKIEYPCAYDYLIKKQDVIQANVAHYDSEELWHIFTREHNHETYNDKKIIVPMTAKDTIGSCELSTGLFMDNSNVWFIKIDGASDELMKAICAIVNSTIFSVLAKAKANPQSGGYYKLNKQFLMPVPFPCDNLKVSDVQVLALSKLSDEIAEIQSSFFSSTPNQKDMISNTLVQKWKELDDICFELYETTPIERSIIQSIGRTVDRVELLNGV